ncbi:D-alanyl-D-alanine carboxypeptidase family protein [Roseomonas sp. E05]|uniref:D-alanyl-D-alanine carboxypeptidase family protein n=1 Tax=Roseomonas sp. E05 TaxID=3046310 RepID=UPI0024BB5FB7|nr:D-alanyl-D-alanine carboxypeptidase family protein [Roseomonas sp. E05]MDJ0389436.1 D-alanyl-D-alanine carboxypeptidase family protein [Roseomonas sp. E05]
MQLARGVRRLRLLAASAILLVTLPGVAAAQIGSARYSSVVIDAQSGQMLFGSNATAPRHPASLTKMMTLYLVFEALRRGELRPDQRLVMTPYAASKPPSKLGLRPGQSLTVENCIYAVVTKSANDIATLLGETLGGGSEARFAQMMTLRARALGMSGTTFRNASGLPDVDQVTTAQDMAALGRRLQQDFPEYYHYFGTREHRMGGIRLRNHNHMLTDYEGVDGIKTGYIDASGFNIVSSARRGGARLIVSVFGGSSWTERDRHAAALLERGFTQMGVDEGRSLVAQGRGGAGLAMAAVGGTAAAATLRRVRAPRVVARAAPAAKPVARRAAPVEARLRSRAARPAARVASGKPSRQAARVRTVVEQGDGGSRVRVASAPRKPVRRNPARPAR